MPVNHYENFPVASILLPARLRPAVETIYTFARTADDLADEGDATREERLAALTVYEGELDNIAASRSVGNVLFARLAEVIHANKLPLQPFRDLLSAFKQDVVTLRYENFGGLVNYCQRSANPVGILMLHLYSAADKQNLRDSDKICTALQLTNFWQDVAIDWKKSRIYLPSNDMRAFAVGEHHIDKSVVDDAWRRLMKFEIDRTRSMLLAGAPLALRLPGRIGWELRLVVQGGLEILARLDAANYDMFNHRPMLKKTDWFGLVCRSVLMKDTRK